MIKNIKLKVTPEQSRKVQEICFSKGIVWGAPGATVSYTDAPYLYITDGRFLTYGHDYHFFTTMRRQEMDANLFIQSRKEIIRKIKMCNHFPGMNSRISPSGSHYFLTEITIPNISQTTKYQ
mgnify:CR=1 FL=1